MKKITFSRGNKILYLLSISGGIILISFIGHVDFSFASNLVGDAPNLSISSMSDNSIIMTPTVPVSGTATDNLQISSITWNVDNSGVLPISGIIPGNSIAWSFDISHLSNGIHILQINATTSAGYVTSKTISFPLYTDSPVPTASLPNGTYKGYQTVKLETSDPALIFYTLDGTTPTLSSLHGQDSITLPEIKSNAILKFFAVDAYGVQSDVSTQVYVISNPMSSTPVVSSTNNVIQSTQKIQTSNMLENETISPALAPPTTVLPKSPNVVSSTIFVLTSQNMTTVHTNSTLSIALQSNSTVSSTSTASQNMTTVNTNSTLPIMMQSNSTVSTTPIITQNMTTVGTNSTMSIINHTNSTLNFAGNGTK
ncbi:MAG: hypothetical protein D4R90_04965 [Nitrosopumilales archaeon]|nr:MAG: hypothetical protein D4R90_04965 [Nitrosopumilales archaeon]